MKWTTKFKKFNTTQRNRSIELDHLVGHDITVNPNVFTDASYKYFRSLM